MSLMLQWQIVKSIISSWRGEGLDLVQFALTYGECLFDPDPAVRESIIRRINRGAEIARQINAHSYLLRPGSLNPDGLMDIAPG